MEESTEGTSHAVERIISAIPLVDHYNPGAMRYAGCDLHDMTMQGWEVVERFEVDEPIVISEQVMPPQQQGYQPPPQELKHSQLGKRAYFRLRKSGNTIVEELNTQLETLRSCASGNEKKIEELQKEIEKLKVDGVQMQSRLKGSQDNCEALRKQKEQVEQIKRQLEGDIGKIREHIGRKMMEEILGEQKKP